MHPPFANIGRVAVKDYKIPNTNQILQKGTSVLVPILSIHHDPEIYPDPETFDPERFSAEESKARNSVAWLPFGDGPRNCTGDRFAMMQVRVALVTLLSKYEFSICPKSVVPMVLRKETFVLDPKYGVWMNVKKVGKVA